MDDLILEFLAETNEALAELDTALVDLERASEDAEILARIFRLVHSVKGTCGFLGLSRLEAVAHAAESLLGLYRDGERPVTPAGVTAVLAAIDTIRLIMAGLAETGAEPEGDDTGLLAQLTAAAAEGEAPAAPPAPPAAAPEPPAASAAALEEEDEEEEDLPSPAASSPAPGSPSAHPSATPATPPSGAPSPATPSGSPAHDPALPVQAIRVSLTVLDELMTLASELVLVRNQLLQVARGQADTPFAAPLQRLSRITSDLQEGVMKTRMQPVSAAWAKLPRLVRDLGAELGKRIDLAMSGGETELDRQVLELIKDPLTHMVRNSADHGLETPEERRAAGKPAAGRISLSARQEGGRIVIQLADDGRGLNLAKVRARAVERGLATEAAVAAMEDAEVARFVFRPGFSTAAAVTAVSGRGVGMDVVRTNIERIGGTVDLQTVPGQGTTITVRIPLTLAIISGLVVQAAGERFAVPQSAVVELVRVGHGGAAVEWLDDTPVMRLRGQLLPLVQLGAMLGLAPPPQGGSAVQGFVAVLQGDAARYGLLVDGVFDTEEIVVKPVAPILRDLQAFSGNTILGDGGVIMILDPAGLARMAGLSAMRQEAATAATSTEEGRSQLLMFRAGGQATPIAVPLGLVARLEALPADSIEIAGNRPAVQYRGQLMPLLPLGPWVQPPAGATQHLLVFQDGSRSLGLMVDEILDVIEEKLVLRPAADRAGFLGSAVIAGRAADVLDCAYWLRLGDPGWFGRGEAQAPRRVLVVEDSGFFRQLVVPALTGAGYEVTACADAAEALKLRAGGAMFDAVLSDIEMPGMDGFALVAELRREGPWAALPVVALSSRSSPADITRGRAAGFTDHVAKFDSERVLEALARALAHAKEAA
ncbi:chemotaxis protein CheW [Roseomonas sp. GC11]|uniref:hybrid sensor histidine kinase/response regulator n=1 Tax=Roseomonas sp. GC11 TaxID=2950546 RepID=UPI00210E7F7D|nr:chemotaxis protein CheW [Roseomonas sp. GC11]MCQ4161978.1 chemotaxis protein CheW [Roseomonas sp. GC11]